MAGMEFSYKISEAEFLSAWKLRNRSSGSPRLKTALFWVFLLLCLILLWSVVRVETPKFPARERPAAPAPTRVGPPRGGSKNLLGTITPSVLICVCLVLLAKLGPTSVLRLYRNDPAMRGQFTVNITPESISTQNTAGVSTKSGWNIYDSWCEGKGLIVLVYRSRMFFVLNLVGLSEMQRDELRGILAIALPQK
jgi:hypothetical protein